MFQPSRFALTATLAFAALSFDSAARADAQVKLGSTERVSHLFAYPNNCSAVCWRPWTLEQTVEHYLTQSVQRDGYAQARVQVTGAHGQWQAQITGVPAGYGKPLAALLGAGDLAYAGARQLNADHKWAYNWSFFLPLGLALEQRKSIELLHFPPDYSLTQAQDYLQSKTTDRWAALLTDNGVAPAQTPGYQTIIDIAPIAAPADAGKQLQGVYGYFTDYQTTMIREVSQGPGATALPIVAFGAPVGKWVEQQYGVKVQVLGLAMITPQPGLKVPVLGSNHPSYIWYAADPANYTGSDAQAQATQAGLKVMGQDLSAACWQVGMAAQPGRDPQALLHDCTQKWQVTQQAQTCELFYTTVPTPTLSAQQAQALCASAPVKAQLQQLAAPAPAATPAYL